MAPQQVARHITRHRIQIRNDIIIDYSIYPFCVYHILLDDIMVSLSAYPSILLNLAFAGLDPDDI